LAPVSRLTSSFGISLPDESSAIESSGAFRGLFIRRIYPPAVLHFVFRHPFENTPRHISPPLRRLPHTFRRCRPDVPFSENPASPRFISLEFSVCQSGFLSLYSGPISLPPQQEFTSKSPELPRRFPCRGFFAKVSRAFACLT